MAKSSYYATGGRDSGRKTNWEPRVNKDPFYRTMDIFNGVFRKNIKLSAGTKNCTDLHTIYINFGELRPSRIAQILRPGADDLHMIFLLECGHEWEGLKIKDGEPKKIGAWGMCGLCGADTAYRGFEHEWQHIIFKSDLAARTVFCQQYADQLRKQIPTGAEIDDGLTNFLHMLVNAFDDIRVNSLWEKVYPGSAMAIWERWRYYTALMENKNTSFLAYIFAVAFGVSTNPQGEFEPMKSVIEWALDQVRYRGFNNMLLTVRVVMDRCMGALLAKMKPAPQKTLWPPPEPSTEESGAQEDNKQQGNDNESEKVVEEDTVCGGQEGQSDTQNEDDQEEQVEEASDHNQSSSSTGDTHDIQKADAKPSERTPGGNEQSGQYLRGAPSAKDIQADDQDRQQAICRLMQDPQQLDPEEEHSPPVLEDLEAAKKSEALRAVLNKILHQDISNLEDLTQNSQLSEPDAEMQAQIDQLQGGITHKSDTSQLTDGSRAKVTIIPVTNAGTGNDRLQLEPDEQAIIKRLRAAFLRSMGKQKAKRAAAGTAVDVEALVQYLGDFQDPNVFENEEVNRGFAYSVVCDMSGSMSRTFPIVCRAVEMLKQALNFPFVLGNLWGFRGGQPMLPGRKNLSGNGEVWMYKYDRDVDWYTGTVPFRLFNGQNGVLQVPVECGGITPMNSAINIATGHLWRKTPAGMAKRMFLLTDGSPLQVRVTGKLLSDFILRQYVANEIIRARKHGIEVYTLIIGEHAITEDKCAQMFGPSKFWTKIEGDRVGTVLLSLVLKNFTRYLRRV